MMSLFWTTRWHLAAVCALLALAPTQASSQTILGRVLDQVNEAPVGGVIVSLVEGDGDERVRTLTDSIGRFVLTPPEAGEYVVVAERFGYLETRSPLISLGMDGQAPLELMLSPAPIGLEGLEVSVEDQASEELEVMGLSPASLGNRFISREAIDAIPVKIDAGVIIERTAQVNIQVIRPENLTPGSDNMGLCISQHRARTGAGQGTCSLIVLNGIPISGIAALDINPDAIESIAVLEPIEATTHYGTMGGSGAVLIWTRRGRTP